MDRVSGVECGRREAPALSLTPDRLKVLQTTAHHHAHRVAARGLDGGTDVADVRQALVLAAWSRIAQFDPRRASWSTFVNLVVRHAAWDLAARFREQRAIATSSLDGDHPACADGGSDQHELVADPQSVGDDSSNPFIAVELGVDVERAVESLPDPCVACVVCYSWNLPLLPSACPGSHLRTFIGRSTRRGCAFDLSDCGQDRPPEKDRAPHR
jgi:DNA-directed RNA polymerase specialized sigma24 family protein